MSDYKFRRLLWYLAQTAEEFGPFERQFPGVHPVKEYISWREDWFR